MSQQKQRDMKNLKDFMTANRDLVIEIINDEVRFTKTNLKEVSGILINSDNFYQELMKTSIATKWDSQEEVAFKSLLKSIVDTLIMNNISKNDDNFWSMIEASTKRQMKAAF